jgi:hypothetical protein
MVLRSSPGLLHHHDRNSAIADFTWLAGLFSIRALSSRFWMETPFAAYSETLAALECRERHRWRTVRNTDPTRPR